MSKLKEADLKELLEELYDKYNRVDFIQNDPVSIPHLYTQKEDIEIAGFFAAILAWGQRAQIIKNAQHLMFLMDNTPFEFVSQASNTDLKRLDKFYYRTFKSVDALFFVRSIREIYKRGSLETVFSNAYKEVGDVKAGLIKLHELFKGVQHEQRSMKHLANVQKGSSAKRLNMYLRWMVRSDNRGVDFGLWRTIPASALYIPIDVHSGRVARELKLLRREQNDWKAVEELTNALKKINPIDPVKYDFALFGFGVNQS